MNEKSEDMDRDVCEIIKVNNAAVEKVQHQMPELSNLAQFFKALSDETRLKITYALTIEQSLCVCDVASIIGSSIATASYHLRHLKKIGLAKSQRNGKMVYYSLADSNVKQLIRIAYEQSKAGVNSEKQ